jgi:glutamate racemase
MVPPAVEIIAQGELVAERLADWLVRHPEMEQRLSRHSRRRYATTDDPAWFASQGEPIMRTPITVEKVRLLPWLGERSKVI